MTAAPRWHEAMRLAAAHAPRTPAHELPLVRCAGETLAHDVAAPTPLPHYASCAMDGHAVSGPGPWRLLPDGDPRRPGAVAPGQALRVLTGSPVPEGAEAVLRQEYTLREGGTLRLAPGAPTTELTPGRHVRPVGEEARAGEVLLSAGRVLSPADVALAAVAGLDTLPVRRRPRVALVRTGDEVRSAGVPGPGEVRDAFGPSLPALLTLLGADLVHAEHIPDDAGHTRRGLAAAAAGAVARDGGGPVDLVLTTGATARSEADHVRRVVEATADVLIEELDVRPGHPTMLSRLGPATWHLGLPGNPLAAMVALRLVAHPFLRAARGLPPEAVADVVVADAPAAGRADRVVPARRDPGRPGLWRPCRRTGSGMLLGLAEADGLVVLPAGDPSGATGPSRVPCLPLPWRSDA